MNRITYIEYRLGLTRVRKDWEVEIADINYYIGCLNNKVLLYRIGMYIQYPLIKHNGKEYKKKNVYMCIIESLYCVAERGTTL